MRKENTDPKPTQFQNKPKKTSKQQYEELSSDFEDDDFEDLPDVNVR